LLKKSFSWQTLEVQKQYQGKGALCTLVCSLLSEGMLLCVVGDGL